jgi:oligopeptide transport system substrate-binding protein
MNEVVADTEDSFARSAGKQLLIFGVLAVVLLGGLMWALQVLASMVGSSTASASALDAATGTITLAIKEEPPQLNSTVATDASSGMILGHVMEGLLRISMDDKLEPAIAERWEVEPTHATFWLRKDARWSDGEPITAHDFIFAWQTAL